MTINYMLSTMVSFSDIIFYNFLMVYTKIRTLLMPVWHKYEGINRLSNIKIFS